MYSILDKLQRKRNMTVTFGRVFQSLSSRLPQRGGKKIDVVGEREKNLNTPTCTIESTVGPCPTITHISKMLCTEVSQHRRPTRSPLYMLMMSGRIQDQT